MKELALILIVVYGLLLTFVLFYSFAQAGLILNYWKKRRPEHKKFTTSERPLVTIQLPIFNERYVVERLLDCIVSLSYPHNKLEIQILDDSTDDTTTIIAEKIATIKSNKNVIIEHIRRKERVGFKAGALAYGTALAKGEFIAIFDADFLPEPNFLLETLPYFENDKVGVVQTKWEHLNKEYSTLTKLQAFGLDAHFSVEQSGRNLGGHFINFNGTAGVWRKKTIVDAGGWQSDTLTEDLDLSYRAQLKGWKFVFLEHVGAPAELPVAMNALKTQQFRWTKGAAECARKNLVNVLKCTMVSAQTKMHAIFHLMNSLLFVCIILLAILSIPMLYVKFSFPEFSLLFKFGAIYLVSLIILFGFYWSSERNESGSTVKSFLSFLIRFPLFLSYSMGLSLHNSIAVIEGYLGIKTPFVRTPKFNLKGKTGNWVSSNYLSSIINPLTIIEGLLTLYFLAGICLGIYLNDWGLFPFHLMLVIGFGSIFYYSISHSLILNNK